MILPTNHGCFLQPLDFKVRFSFGVEYVEVVSLVELIESRGWKDAVLFSFTPDTYTGSCLCCPEDEHD